MVSPLELSRWFTGKTGELRNADCFSIDFQHEIKIRVWLFRAISASPALRIN